MANIVIVSEQCQPLTQLMYGWSKYGGPLQGLVQEPLENEWHCQACGLEYKLKDPSYDFEVEPREFIKICAPCQTEVYINNIAELAELVRIVRRVHSLF